MAQMVLIYKKYIDKRLLVFPWIYPLNEGFMKVRDVQFDDW